MRRGARTDNRK